MSYIDRIEKALFDEQLLEADQLISAGSTAFPDSMNFQPLRQKLSSKKNIAIDKLLGQAELSLAQGHLLKPEDDSALLYYQEISYFAIYIFFSTFKIFKKIPILRHWYVTNAYTL